jgi:hypothetical protein
MTPEDAQAEAIRRIHHARDTGADWLDLGDLPIEAVPADIRTLRDQLRLLALGTYKPTWPEGRLVWELEASPFNMEIYPYTGVQ